ncbi:MAG: low molecular weight phosphatase family protein [Pseudomonadota bacterium]
MSLPGSVLFCCDHNAVRSPMAEGILKHDHGREIFVQSAGVHDDLEIDGFMITVAAEIGVNIAAHRARSFEQMKEWGDDISSFDRIIALSPAAQRHALEQTRDFHVVVSYWPTLDPTGLGETREDKLSAYRQTRDQILERIRHEFPIEDH